jgi:tryptophan synthase alpha subunit
VRVADIFDMVRAVREEVSLPFSAMVSYAIVDRVGLQAFVGRAAGAVEVFMAELTQGCQSEPPRGACA